MESTITIGAPLGLEPAQAGQPLAVGGGVGQQQVVEAVLVEPEALGQREGHQPAEARVALQDRARAAGGSAPTCWPRGSACPPRGRASRPRSTTSHRGPRARRGRRSPGRRPPAARSRRPPFDYAGGYGGVRAGPAPRALRRRSPFSSGPRWPRRCSTRSDRAGPCSSAWRSAAVLLAVAWRPRVSEHSRRDLLLAALFGLSLAGMNLAFYEAIDRIPLGVAVTFEFVGPLGRGGGGIAARARRPVGRARRRRDPAALGLRLHGPRPDRRGARPPRRRLLGGVHPAGRAGGAGVPGRRRPGARDGGGRRGAAPGGRGRRRQRAAGARGARHRRRRGGALVGDPLLARARGAPAHAARRLRRAHEPRAGPGHAGRLAWCSGRAWPRASSWP